MDYKNDDQMLLFSQYYPAPTYTQIDVVPQQDIGDEPEKAKKIRRRKKGKIEENESSSGFRKRKLSDEQTNELELNFNNDHKLESHRKDRLASELGLDPRQVAIWFQNRRARWKCKKMEEEYSKLKNLHESTLVEKCHLQSQVVKLKEQLFETEKEKEKLMKRSINNFNGCLSNNSSCSSSSMEPFELEPPFLGEFMLDIWT